MADTDYREILESKRLEITERLNCERTYLWNYLRCTKVLDKEDCELILSEKTNKSRAGRFVDELLLKGPEGYQHFIDVIQVENPYLYESLTGLKPTSKPSPLKTLKLQTNSELNSGVCYFGLGMLADHQQRLYSELQEVHRQCGTLLKEKQEVESRLVRAHEDLKFEKERRVEYEKAFKLEDEQQEHCEKQEMLILQEYDDLQKGVADRDVYIIVLQMKLLAEKEECDNLRSKVSELQHKTENMEQQLRRVSESYNHERRQSSRLSECIRIQGEDIQRMDVLKKKLRESQFQNILMKDERDCAKEELSELKEWAEALKTRFDVIEKEKYDYQEKNELVTNNFATLQESVRTLQRKVSLCQLENEEMKKRNEMLVKDSEIYKKQRDCALDARKEAIFERDKAVSEKERIQVQYNDGQEKRDKMNEERAQLIQDYDRLESRYKAAHEELTQLRLKLNEKELEVGDLTRSMIETEEKYRRNSCLLNMSRPASMVIPQMNDTAAEPDNSVGLTEENEDKPPGNKSRWRDRKLKSLLDSMKSRISGARSLEDIAKDPVSPASENMTLQVLQCLLPNISSRPYMSSYQPGSDRRPLCRTMATRRRSDDKTDAKKKRASTLPLFKTADDIIDVNDETCDRVENSRPDSAFDNKRHSKDSKFFTSAPDLRGLHSDELDILPGFFRSRSNDLSRRRNSDLK